MGTEHGKKLANRAQDEKVLVHRVKARHSSYKLAARQPSCVFDCLCRVINRVRGCKVMLTRNIRKVMLVADLDGRRGARGRASPTGPSGQRGG